jgi:WD40 repeat protein
MLIHKEQVHLLIQYIVEYCGHSRSFVVLVAATCALDAQIKLWDIESGKLIRDIDATPG